MRYDDATGRYLSLPPLSLRQSNHPKTSPDGKSIFISSIIGNVRIFDSQTLQQTATIGGFMFSARGLAFSPDGMRLFGGGSAQEFVTVLDSQNYERLLTLPANAYGLNAVGLSPDGNVLMGDAGGVLHFWRAPSLEEIAKAEAVAERDVGYSRGELKSRAEEPRSVPRRGQDLAGTRGDLCRRRRRPWPGPNSGIDPILRDLTASSIARHSSPPAMTPSVRSL